MSYAARKALTVEERNKFSGMSDVVARLLHYRGITDDETAKRFLGPDYERDMHDPFLLKDAEKAAARIIQAIKGNEKIAIYADYDADGIPGAAIFNDFFRRIGFKDFVIYIPHRHDEGFGLNTEAIDQLAGEGVKLLITIDCGISDAEAVAHANKKGIEVIITDHHEPPQELPPAFAVIDHKQTDCAYPEKILCGSGVAYKLIQAILAKDRFGLKEGHEKWLLDLVGLATLSDMVPLIGENRALAHYGLQVLRKSQRKGLARLFSKLNISQKHVTEDDIAFMITPRINAASRMGVPMDAFRLLTADNDDDAYRYAEHLDRINDERKGAVAALVKEVKKVIKARDALPNVIVLGNPAWRPSLLGLAANSCAEEFDRPVFLWGRDGDNAIKGSCRSEGRTHMVQLMRAAPAGAFTQFGGHQHSGGFAVHNDQIHFLEQRLNEAIEKIRAGGGIIGDDAVGFPSEALAKEGQRGTDDATAADLVDLELSLDAVDYKLFDDINRLAPFGVGNPKPIFLFKGVQPSSIRRFGKANDHMELVFNKKDGQKIPAISFFGAASDWAKNISTDKAIDLVASLEKSMYRNREELRLRVVDVIY